MRTLLILSTLIIFTLTSKGQYPFEKYLAVKYSIYHDWKIYDRAEDEKKVHSTLTIPNFFGNNDSLTIQLTSFTDHCWDNSIIRVFQNKQQTQKFVEDMIFNPAGLDTVRVADINGDGLMDVKIVSPYLGNGIASLNVKVIYLFQRQDHSFNKISFDDKSYPNIPERDFDRDGNYEIITITNNPFLEYPNPFQSQLFIRSENNYDN